MLPANALRVCTRTSHVAARSIGRLSVSTKANSSNNFLKSAALLAAAGGAAVLLTQAAGSPDRRKRALEKLDTSRAARATPKEITEKVEEAQATVPATEEVEDHESQQSAYDPATGEINWDCPCLGGMAHGPCGEEFKTAFSCFVHSEEDPKGVDCIEKFKSMQDCFRQHPEIYAKELADDGEDEESLADSDVSLSDSQLADVSDSASSAADSISEKAKEASDKVSEVASSAALSVSSLLSTDSSNSTESTSSTKIRNQGSTQKAYSSHGDPSHKGTGASSGADSLHPEKTSNRTNGKAEPLGRNAAIGDRPSGAKEDAHAKHLEGVKATRSGENASGSRGQGMRG